MTYWFPELNSAFPSWLLWVTAIGLGGGAYVLNCRQKASPSWEKGLRFLVAFLLFFEIGQLTFVERLTPGIGLCVLLDDSQSMTLPEAESGGKISESSQMISRFEAARRLLEDLEALLKKEDVSLKTVRLSELAGGEKIAANEDSNVSGFPVSPLGTALEAVLRTNFWRASTVRLSGVVLLTDGVSTDGDSAERAARQAQNRKCALFPIVLGGKTAIPQLYAEWRKPQTAALCGEDAFFRVRVYGTSLPSSRLTVCLKETADSSDSVPLAETTANFAADSGILDLKLRWTPKTPGERKLFLKCDLPDSKGSFLINPSFPVLLHAEDGVRRVLLVTNSPDWEFRCLRNLLARESSVRLETWSPPEAPLAPDPAQDAIQRETFPSEEELRQFDVVILNSVSISELGEENSSLLTKVWSSSDSSEGPISGKHSRLRGFVVIAGRNFQPEAWQRAALGRLIPISFAGMALAKSETPSGWPISLTASGLAAPQFRDLSETKTIALADGGVREGNSALALPTLFTFWRIPHTFSGAEVWAEADGEPILVFGRTGTISSLFLATENLWRWRKNDESAYRRFWVQSVHALCREDAKPKPEVSPARKLKSEAEAKKTSESAEFAFESLLESSSGTVSETVSETSLSSETPIPGQPLEFRRTSANHDAMRVWAQASGGCFFDSCTQDASQMAQEILLTLQTRASQSGTEVLESRWPVWRSPFLWLTLCGVLGVLWVQSRRRA